MADNKDKTKKKKTLSLKLGAKPMIAPKRNIEAGKTVIVEKKRYKKNTGSETLQPKNNFNESNAIEEKFVSNIEEKPNDNKSGVVLKPLSKDEQKEF